MPPTLERYPVILTVKAWAEGYSGAAACRMALPEMKDIIQLGILQQAHNRLTGINVLRAELIGARESDLAPPGAPAPPTSEDKP